MSSTAASLVRQKACVKAPLTKNHIFLSIHHIMGPGEGLAQTSHVLWREQTVVSPAGGAKRGDWSVVTDQQALL